MRCRSPVGDSRYVELSQAKDAAAAETAMPGCDVARHDALDLRVTSEHSTLGAAALEPQRIQYVESGIERRVMLEHERRCRGRLSQAIIEPL